MKTESVKIGVVAEKDGKYWGMTNNSAVGLCMGWTSIQNAEIGNPKEYRKPTDFIRFNSRYQGDFIDAKLLKIKVTTIFETIE